MLGQIPLIYACTDTNHAHNFKGFMAHFAVARSKGFSISDTYQKLQGSIQKEWNNLIHNF